MEQNTKLSLLHQEEMKVQAQPFVLQEMMVLLFPVGEMEVLKLLTQLISQSYGKYQEHIEAHVLAFMLMRIMYFLEDRMEQSGFGQGLTEKCSSNSMIILRMLLDFSQM